MEPFEWKIVHERVAFKRGVQCTIKCVCYSLNSLYTMADMSTDWPEYMVAKENPLDCLVIQVV